MKKNRGHVQRKGGMMRVECKGGPGGKGCDEGEDRPFGSVGERAERKGSRIEAKAQKYETTGVRKKK